jgi:hypothetical protein
MELRRHALIACAAFALASVAHAALRAYPLDERSVYAIRIGRDEPTTCVFPGPLTALEGAGVAAKADDTPAVLLSYQAGAAFFSVRALRDNATGALNVVFRGKIYALSFVTGGETDRTVTFLDEPLTGANRQPPDPAAIRALLERAKQHEKILAQYPALVSAIARAEPGSVTPYPTFTVTVEEVSRFDAEDIVVFRLRFANPGDAPVRYDRQKLAVRVGADVFPAALTDASGAIPPKGSTCVYLAIAGTPGGGRANLSVREKFSVLVPPAPPAPPAA